MYPATAAKRKPAVNIISKERIAGSNRPEIIHTIKNIGIAIAALVMAIERAGKSSSVRMFLASGTFDFVSSIISVMPLKRASLITTKV